MRPPVVDANVLIDLYWGELVACAGALEGRLAVPDTVLREEVPELQDQAIANGWLEVSLDARGMRDFLSLRDRHARAGTSAFDLQCLALARRTRAMLVTGDRTLRAIAASEGVEVHGTLWIVERLHVEQGLDRGAARRAYDRMRDAASRLPWDEVDAQLRGW